MEHRPDLGGGDLIISYPDFALFDAELTVGDLGCRLVTKKNCTMPEHARVVQTHSNCSKNKNVHNSNETAIIPKMIILKLRILCDRDRKGSKIRNL